MSFEDWYNKTTSACNSHDADRAYSAYREWDEMVAQTPATSRNKLLQLKERLLFTSFPVLPTNRAVEIVEKQLLKLLGNIVDADEVIKNRFLYLGYGNQEGDRKALHDGILRNNQRLGEKTIAQWLQLFDKTFPPEEREENATLDFFTRDPSIVSMGKVEQALLQKMLKIYDEWFAVPIITIYDVAVFYQKLVDLENKGVKTVDMKTFRSKYLGFQSGSQKESRASEGPSSQAAATKVERLPLLKAMADNPNLGQQPITNAKIKLKNQVEPQRPTLSNWIRYYREELGIGHHDPVQRGHFLFQTENGEKLSSEERDRLNLILKSLEEDFPLEIDTQRQVIVFPTRPEKMNLPPQAAPPRMVSGPPTRPAPAFFGRNQINEPKVSPAAALLPTAPALPRPSTSFQRSPAFRGDDETQTLSFRRGGFHAPTAQPVVHERPLMSGEKNVANDTLHFSTGHVLPAEKMAAPPAPSYASLTAAQKILPPRQNPTPPRDPYTIRPLRSKSGDGSQEKE